LNPLLILEGMRFQDGIDHIESKLPFRLRILGEQTVKNIAKPVGALESFWNQE